jgi:hypothetical protein
MTDLDRDMGRLVARQDFQDERLARIESKVDQLVEYMASAQGGWRLLLAVGGIAASFAAGSAEFVHCVTKL